jgi:hypothetical protein
MANIIQTKDINLGNGFLFNEMGHGRRDFFHRRYPPMSEKTIG